MNQVDYALEYLKRGYSIIPCRADKKPLFALIDTWEEFQTRRPTEAEVLAWWGKHPQANIGIICGPISGLTVVDCDSPAAWEALDEYLPDSLMAPVSLTPTGNHQIFFKHKPGLHSQNRVMDETDIKTDGGYVIAPPSICEYEKNGKHIKGGHSWKVNGIEPPEMPPELADELEKRQVYLSTTTGKGGAKKPEGWRDELFIGVPEGQRNDTAAKLAGDYIRRGLSDSEVLALLTEWNTRNLPPLDERELQTVVASIRKTDSRNTLPADPEQPSPAADRARKDISVINAGTWLETEPPPPDHILEDTLDAGDKMAILASSKLRKSFFFAQLAIALAAHPKFLGWTMPKNRRVLFCQFEIRDHHCHRRIRNLARAMGISSAHLGDRLMIINGRGLGLAGKEGLDKIMAAIGDFKPEVIMIDPLYKFSEGVENQAEDFKKLLAAFDELAEQTGAAIIYVHHDTKGSPGDKDIRDRGAGSNVLGRDYDACMTLTPHATDPDATVVEVLLRNYPPQDPFTILWSSDEVPGGYRFNLAADILPFKRTSKTKPAPPALSTYLPAAADVLVGKNKLEIGFFRSAFKEKTGLSDIRIRDFIAWATGDKNPPMRTLEERGKGIHRKWVFMSEAS